MSDQQKAYLVVHLNSFYNDEYCEVAPVASVEFVDPQGVFLNLAEAQAAAQRLELEFLREAQPDYLNMDEHGYQRLAEYIDDPETVDDPLPEKLAHLLHEIEYGEEQTPFAELSDEELLAIQRDLPLSAVYAVIEAALTPQQFSEARGILETTPERPAEWEFDYELEEFQQDEAVQRLERVTRMFGRDYGLDRSGV